jgi:hypothetical protein
MAGKTSISSMIKSKSKEESLRNVELEIEKAQKDEAELTLICKFKKLREHTYYQQLRQLAKFEHEYAKSQNELWQSIIQSESIQKVVTNE